MTVYNINAMRSAYEPLRVIAFGSILGAYDPVNVNPVLRGYLGTPLAQTARIVTIKNNTNSDVYISLDGIEDHEWLPASTFDKNDHSTNHANTNGGFLGVPAFTQFFIRYGAGAPISGQVTLSIVYGSTT